MPLVLRSLSAPLRNLALGCACLSFIACADDEPGSSTDGSGEGVGEPADLDIAGLWVDGFGAEHDITTETWTMAFPPMEGSGEPSVSSFTLLSFSNEDQWAIARNSDTNPFSSGLFSRFDWTWVGQDLWFCQTAYDAASAEAASATPPADPADPANSGCGGFSWSSLAPRVDR